MCNTSALFCDQHQYKNALDFKNKVLFSSGGKFIHSKLFDILNDLNNNREKLHLIRNKMQNHSDINVLTEVTNFIVKFLNEKN